MCVCVCVCACVCVCVYGWMGGGCPVIIGDTLPVVLKVLAPEVPLLHNRQFIIALVAVTCFFPISLVRDLSRLWLSSLLSVLCIPFILISVAVRGFARDDYVPFPVVLASANFFPAIGAGSPSVCVSLHESFRACVCMYVCMCVCLVCMRVCMCVCLHARVCV
jgi:hypothetical protein